MCCSKGGRKRERNGRGSGGRNDGSGHHSESNEWAQPHSYKLLSYFRLKSFGFPKFIPRIFSSSPGNPYRSYSHFPPFSSIFSPISHYLSLIITIFFLASKYRAEWIRFYPSTLMWSHWRQTIWVRAFSLFLIKNFGIFFLKAKFFIFTKPTKKNGCQNVLGSCKLLKE